MGDSPVQTADRSALAAVGRVLAAIGGSGFELQPALEVVDKLQHAPLELAVPPLQREQRGVPIVRRGTSGLQQRIDEPEDQNPVLERHGLWVGEERTGSLDQHV